MYRKGLWFLLVIMLAEGVYGRDDYFGAIGWEWKSDSCQKLADRTNSGTASYWFYWRSAEPTQGEFRCSTAISRLRNLRDRGYKVHFKILSVPLWASMVPVKKEDINTGTWDRWDSLSYNLLVKSLNYAYWPPESTIWWKRFVGNIVSALIDSLDSLGSTYVEDSVFISIWNEPDGTRVGLVYRFYKLYIDDTTIVYADSTWSDTIFELVKEGSETAGDTVRVTLEKRLITGSTDTIDLGSFVLKVDTVFANFVKYNVWTPEYYAEKILIPACDTIDTINSRIRVTAAAPMYATYVDFPHLLPDDATWRYRLHWQAYDYDQLKEWLYTMYDSAQAKYHIDALTHHFYVANLSHYTSPLDTLPTLLDSLKTWYDDLGMGDLPFYVTEFGFATDTLAPDNPVSGPTYDSQAVYYSDFLEVFDAYKETLNIGLVQCYRFDDEPQHKDYYGIVYTGSPTTFDFYRQNPVPKPAYYVFKDFIKATGEPYLWARDTKAISNSNGNKVVYRGNGIDIVYQSNGVIVFVSAGASGVECDTIYQHNGHYCDAPALVLRDNGEEWVVFREDGNRLLLMRRMDGRWSNPLEIFTNDARVSEPALAVDGLGYVHVGLAAKKLQSHLFYVIYEQIGGLNVIEVDTLDSLNTRRPHDNFLCKPSISCRDIGAFLPPEVWLSWYSKDGEVFLAKKRYHYTEPMWERPIRLYNGSSTLRNVVIDVDKSGWANVVWEEGGNILFERTDGKRVHFPEYIYCSSGYDWIYSPYPTHIGGVVYVFWSKKEIDLENPFIDTISNVYVSVRNLKSGAPWQTRRLANTHSNSNYPQGVAGDSTFYVVWTEWWPGRSVLGRVEVDSTLRTVPEVYVISPGDGDYYEPWDTIEVRWTVRASVAPVRDYYIYLSRDGGDTYELIDSVEEYVTGYDTLEYEMVWPYGDEMADSCRVKVVAVDMADIEGLDESRGYFGVWWMVSGYGGATEPNTGNIVKESDTLYVVYLDEKGVMVEVQGNGQEWENILNGSAESNPNYPSLMPEIGLSQSGRYIVYMGNKYEPPQPRLCRYITYLSWVLEDTGGVIRFDTVANTDSSWTGYGFDVCVESDSMYVAYVLASGDTGLYYSSCELVGGEDTVHSEYIDRGVVVDSGIAHVSVCRDSSGGMHIFYVKEGALCHVYGPVDTLGVGNRYGAGECRGHFQEHIILCGRRYSVCGVSEG